MCISVVALTLILNIIVAAWAATSFGLSEGVGTIHQGPCHAIKKAGLWLHIAINILSTTLLGASNYCMQLVCGTYLGDNMTLETYSIDDYDCSILVALSNDTQWIMANQPVEYCLSQVVQDRCRLQFAVPIMIVVLVCNSAKLLCMIITLWKCGEPTFVTLGDALAGFLEKPDRWTVGMCISNKLEFLDEKWPDPSALPQRWSLKRHFRYEAVGLRRFILSNSVCAIAVISCSISLRFAIANTTTSSDIVTLYNIGFGTVSASSLIRWGAPIFGSPGLMKNVLLANSPQLVLSLLYIIYNRMYTCMSLSKEWHSLAHKSQSLRVTNPKGSQRSTYFLSLPYHYSLLILIISVSTHWILSQSLFLVAIDVFSLTGTFDASQSILSCGFSCIALIFLVGIGWLVFIIGTAMGFRRYESGMPLAGSCSGVISAACHPPEDEVDVGEGLVKWGVTGVERGVGHCSLSSGYVSEPVSWRLYKGNGG